jgi:segregation and condensation protein B
METLEAALQENFEKAAQQDSAEQETAPAPDLTVDAEHNQEMNNEQT